MELLVVRHAIAEDREAFAKTGQEDDRRPLTTRGRERMETGARGLASLRKRVDVLASSPLTRAVETAEVLAEVWPGVAPVVVSALSPAGDYDQLTAWLRALGADQRIVIVGHEPHLSGFVTRLLGGRGSAVRLKKGAACLLSIAPSAGPGSGVLHWALTPRQLRRLAPTD